MKNFSFRGYFTHFWENEICLNWIWTTLSGKCFEPTRKRNGPLSPITLLLDRMMSNMKRKKLSIEELSLFQFQSIYFVFCIFWLHHFLPALSSNTFVQLAEKCLFWDKSSYNTLVFILLQNYEWHWLLMKNVMWSLYRYL